MIFAAGIGSRLRPLTDTTPKALIEIGGKPMLQRVIENIVSAGITDIVVNVHHHASKVIEFVESWNPQGVHIAISDESASLLDTGGGVAKAYRLLSGDDVLLHNADILTDVDLKSMIAAHRTGGRDATLLTSDRPSSRRLLFDADGRMRGWINMTTGETRPSDCDPQPLTPMAFGGIHVVSPGVVESLVDFSRTQGEKFSITDFYISLCNRLSIGNYTPSNPFSWFDIGRPQTLADARSWISNTDFVEG